MTVRGSVRFVQGLSTLVRGVKEWSGSEGRWVRWRVCFFVDHPNKKVKNKQGSQRMMWGFHNDHNDYHDEKKSGKKRSQRMIRHRRPVRKVIIIQPSHNKNWYFVVPRPTSIDQKVKQIKEFSKIVAKQCKTKKLECRLWRKSWSFLPLAARFLICNHRL